MIPRTTDGFCHRERGRARRAVTIGAPSTRMQESASYMRAVAAEMEPVTSSSKEQISAEENFSIRRSNLPSTCLLHYDKAPLRLSSAKFQYLYDDRGNEYIDCAVGHCHPALVAASRSHVGSLFTAFRDLSLTSDLAEYPGRLLATCPAGFDTALFTSTGSEAIDLSLQLARGATSRQDVVVVDNCFHGCLSTTIELSPRELKRKEQEPKEWVHVVPMPDMYRGPHAGKEDAAELYFQDAKRVIEAAIQRGRQIACFLSEPVFTAAGMAVPPRGWLKKMHDYIHSIGALTIVDEMCTALGRNGSTFWGFQREQGTPDFICCGKPIGNGYPMAAALTRKTILNAVREPDLTERYRPTPLVCAIGSRVLQVMEREDLMAKAKRIGRMLKKELLLLKNKHGHIGDVRGEGLQMGVEFVNSQAEKKPDREVCQCVIYRLKEDERIVAAAEGEFRNVMYVTPPLCFSEENARRLVTSLDRVLTQLHTHGTDIGFSSLGASSLQPATWAAELDITAYEDVD
ncbi:ethanolamine-phosphate phospho-lyase-like isoform X2 [Pollicipes pollicipes]|uniref:ethanolamine-phosphate phospho-lyase-like isoform X2 n=1 Tax=Pollicipes pollicipes TaxID=41117 RepID=UPI0018856762|nr:ethanolamine-phosphate phospho-lyase-like isoform X2 [Pollicipes pollicipes]